MKLCNVLRVEVLLLLLLLFARVQEGWCLPCISVLCLVSPSVLLNGKCWFAHRGVALQQLSLHSLRRSPERRCRETGLALSSTLLLY